VDRPIYLRAKFKFCFSEKQTRKRQFFVGGEEKEIINKMACYYPSGKWFLSVVLAVLVALLAVQAAGPSSGGHQRNSKMKPPPIISEESSNKNRRTSGKFRI
jgi:hypothetical protein